ncbi:MAG: 50S ribosomal protein L23 [Nitrospirae bacterium GWC2_57_13]|jgi:large subunit ribosomal protein L23|nr:MAG: 50S ribosomal protein L23 [Nitrospirae bacterium GWC1_57_7]OGW28825.1 MAG: 50S ribosomal protein L23 [Nitrospirae bacterium GWC2_57_13]OGW44614.1 MAG: 50S ribosomal protein L23 [Nitrospirae bacterium GWD2_57_8]
MTNEHYDIIRMPRITEKGSRQKDKNNVLTFVVRKDANKLQVRKAIETIFKVKVLDVTTVVCAGKKKRLGARQGSKPDWKKAYVTLKAGEKIDIFEGA